MDTANRVLAEMVIWGIEPHSYGGAIRNPATATDPDRADSVQTKSALSSESATATSVLSWGFLWTLTLVFWGYSLYVRTLYP